MSSYILYDVARTLSDSDWQFIYTAIKANIFVKFKQNVQSRLIDLATHIQQHFSHSPEAELKKELLWQTIYPQKKYNDARMRQEMTQLLQVIESLLPYLQLKNNICEQQVLLIEYYAHKHNIHKYFAKKIEDIHKQTPQDWGELTPEKRYYYQYRLQEAQSIVASQYPSTNHNVDLSQVSQLFNLHYIVEKMRYALHIITKQNHIADGTAFTDEIIQYISIREAYFKQEPAIWIYYKTYMLLNSQFIDIKDINEHLVLLQNSLNVFSLQEKNNLFTYITNHLIELIANENNYNNIMSYYRYCYELYLQVGIPQKLIYLANGKIAPDVLRNILVFAFNAYNKEDPEFAISTPKLADFINSIEIYADNNQVYAHAAQSFLLFMNGKYADAIRNIYINELPDNLFWVLDLCRINLKSYYELGDIDGFERELSNFKVSLYRNSIKNFDLMGFEKQKHQNINFIKFITKIAHLSTFKNEARISKIRTALLSETGIVDKKWLLSKLKNLE